MELIQAFENRFVSATLLFRKHDRDTKKKKENSTTCVSMSVVSVVVCERKSVLCDAVIIVYHFSALCRRWITFEWDKVEWNYSIYYSNVSVNHLVEKFRIVLLLFSRSPSTTCGSVCECLRRQQRAVLEHRVVTPQRFGSYFCDVAYSASLTALVSVCK